MMHLLWFTAGEGGEFELVVVLGRRGGGRWVHLRGGKE